MGVENLFIFTKLMTPVIAWMAEARASMDVTAITHITSESSLQDPGVSIDQFSRSKDEETQLPVAQDLQEEQMVARVASGTSVTSSTNCVSLVPDGVTSAKEQIEPRATKLRVMAEHEPKASALDPGCTALLKEKTLEPRTFKRTLSRTAAAAAAAGIPRQVKEETGSLERVISSSLEQENRDLKHHGKKKRTTEHTGRGARKKRSRGTTSKLLLQNTLETGSAEQHCSRGTKRRHSAKFQRAWSEASPVITDIPPLPFTTTSPELRSIGRNTSMSRQSVTSATKLTHSMKKMSNYDDRKCEYCKKVANICGLMHCNACCRVYHAQCFLHTFKPYVDESMPIFGQMEQLQLNAPEHRSNIFRCASCKAAFLDFYESGGYLWDCKCPTCSQPEKIVFYRQRKLVQMMNNMELEKQRKKQQKEQKKNGTLSVSGKPPLSIPSRLGSTSHSRRTITPDGHVASSKKAQISTSRPRDASLNGHELTKRKPVNEPEQPELSGDDLVGAVKILRDDKNGGWCFPIVCSRSLSLRESSVMKTGKCKWFPEKNSLFQCDCCDRDFSLPEFVHHTNSTLVKSEKAANGQSMPFLFVEHQNAGQHTLFEHFQPALRNWVDRQIAKNTPTQPYQGRAAKQEVFTSAGTRAVPMASPSTAIDALQTRVSRLQALALFKRPNQKSDKASTATHLIDLVTLDFVAQVVCLSPSYVISMQNGTLADLVARSKTTAPEDSFPRKAGWLPFNRNPALARQVACFCCSQSFNFDDFVGHAGISLRALNKRSYQLLYVVERQDEAALVPYTTFLSDLEFITINGADMFLDELLPPPSPPRPV